MRLPIYQIDAFADRIFTGNPAAVCPLETWLPAPVMQSIALENNLSETAFFVPMDGAGDGESGADYAIRWFTPMNEIDLAGHPTLATAHLILTRLTPDAGRVVFATQSGDRLTVTREEGGRLAMDFPSRPPAPGDVGGDVAGALRATPTEILRSRDGFAVFETEAEVAALRPDMSAVADLNCLGIIATAPGNEVDFVSRFFAPASGVPEDPVTGSAHTTLIPYWAEQLGKSELVARQISSRGGTLWCRHAGARVVIAGTCADYMEGTITL